MSQKTETYTAFGRGEPHKIADIISDAFIDSVKQYRGEEDEYIPSMNIETAIFDDKINIGGIVTPYPIDLDPSKYKDPLKTKIARGCTLGLVGMELNEMVEEIDEGWTYSNLYEYNDTVKNSTVVGHAVYDSPDYLPPHVHLANRIKKYLMGRIDGNYKDVSISVRCCYDMEDKIFRSIDIRITYTKIFEHTPLTEDFLKNNEMGLEDNITSKLKFSGRDKTKFNVRYVEVPDIVDSIGLSSKEVMKQYYGPRFPGLSTAGKTMDHPQRGGAYLARYIAKNIIGTKKFNEATVYMDYNNCGSSDTPNIFTKALMGNAEVEFEFPEHFNEELHNIFPTTMDGVVRSFLNDETPEYYKLSTHEDLGEEVIDRPWEKMDKVNAVDNIRV